MSSNLGEFFEIWAALHLAANQPADTRGVFTVEPFKRGAAKAHSLVERQYALYKSEIMPALEKAGIRVVSHGDRNAAQRA